MSDDIPVHGNVRDAAVLLLSLGEQAAAEVMRHLGPKEIERVGLAISKVGPLSVTRVAETVSTFLEEVQTDSSTGKRAGAQIRNR